MMHALKIERGGRGWGSKREPGPIKSIQCHSWRCKILGELGMYILEQRPEHKNSGSRGLGCTLEPTTSAVSYGPPKRPLPSHSGCAHRKPTQSRTNGIGCDMKPLIVGTQYRRQKVGEEPKGAHPGDKYPN